MIKQRKNAGTRRDKKKKTRPEKITIQLDEINQKVLVKEGKAPYIDQHILNENKTRRYGSAKLDNKLPQNVQNIRRKGTLQRSAHPK